MMKYCFDKWNKNQDKLLKAIKKDKTLNDCEYVYLVKLVVHHILNDGKEELDYYDDWDADEITVIDSGGYQGTLLFLIPKGNFPMEYQYIMTFVNYGSCPGCDTLQGIQLYTDEEPTDVQAKEYLALCKDIVTNMIVPYNTGWRQSDEFNQVEFE